MEHGGPRKPGIVFMQRETTIDATLELQTLIAQLKQERAGLRVKIHLFRCGIQQEWNRAETKWRNLCGPNGVPDDTAWRLARELKDFYIRIYQGLLAKSCLLLDRLNRIRQESDAAALQNLKRQTASELEALRLRLETLGGAQSLCLPTEAAPVCACLQCRHKRGKQPVDLDRMLIEARQIVDSALFKQPHEVNP